MTELIIQVCKIEFYGLVGLSIVLGLQSVLSLAKGVVKNAYRKEGKCGLLAGVMVIVAYGSFWFGVFGLALQSLILCLK